MKRIICFCCLLFSFAFAFSQKVYFIYLQTETEQPFFVKLNETVYSSNSSGYLILSKLRDSSYKFTVGFPQNKWPEQQFTVAMKGTDHGFLIKNFGDKGWGLFDLQTLSIQMGTDGSKEKTIKTEPKQVSMFTEVLSKAANDPTLKEKPIAVAVKNEEKSVSAEPALVKGEAGLQPQIPVVNAITVTQVPEKKDNPPMPKAEETIAVKDEPVNLPKETVVIEEKKEEPKPLTETEYKRSEVTRRSESSTTEGFGVTFIDAMADGKKDTIKILIPNPKSLALRESEMPVEEKKVPVVTEEKRNNPTLVVPVSEEKTASLSPRGCISVAGDVDFFKLRKKMAAEISDNDMVAVAQKAFKAKCYTTAQVKNLSTLFLNDGGKYKFFEAAYGYVSDAPAFAGLEGELKDVYYISQFKAMLK